MPVDRMYLEGKMKVRFHICLLLLPIFSQYSYGNPGIHYLNEDPIAVDDQLDPCDTVHGINREDINSKHSDVFDLHPNRKNRADDRSSIKDLKYGVPRQESFSDDVKTISFPALFTPRFGRKRYALQPNFDGQSDATADNTMSRLGISKASIYLNSRNAHRLGQFKSYNKKTQSHRNEFTPRLGRSSAQNLVQLSAGSAFTPRLGRTAGYKQIRLNAGSVFTPRLGRSENQNNQIHLNAGGAFTPRFGRFVGDKLDKGNAEGEDQKDFRILMMKIPRTSENSNMIS